MMKLMFSLDRLFETTSYGNRAGGTVVTLGTPEFVELGQPSTIEVIIEPCLDTQSLSSSSLSEQS